MQTSNRFLDDLTKLASGAASTLAGVRQEIDGLIRQQLERLLVDMDLVRRDEFEAVKATAANARSAQENLERRMTDLEAQLAALRSGPSQAQEANEPEAKTDPSIPSEPEA